MTLDVDRRSLLKGLAAAATTLTVLPGPAEARERRTAPPDAVGLLYDTTRCIGCKACVVACKEANGMPADTDGYGGGLYDAPEGLNEFTRNVIQLYDGEDESSFVKRQCMHCIDPACVGACMLGALQKREHGIVTWDGSKCVGCRYCQMACPFNVPKFQWSKRAPRIVKCELCSHRLKEGKIPACAEVCPRQAVIFGRYTDLLDDAHRRLAEQPDRYVPKVYGEHDLGGTQCLYLSDVPFEKLGFRFQHDEPVPELQQTVQHGIYQGFAAPLALYALLGAVMFRNRKQGEAGEDGPEEPGRRS
ncbi:MAG TPA: hydrogenase 2 operon protein HybA [Thermoanaerobaculia bacterium]|nr:hydrogenase 2 operon protein HybA [Thermoanaerobaculia bacterium]